MRALFAAVSVLVACPVFAQGVSRPARSGETIVAIRSLGGATGAGTLTQVPLPADRGFSVTAVTTRVVTAAVGDGTVTWRVSDGTLNCDCSGACLTTGTTGFGDAGGKRQTCAGSCAFAPGAYLTFSVQASTCATSQPVVQMIEVRGHWR